MDIGIIARRYARALLLFACENGHETLVYEQAQQLLFQYNQLPGSAYDRESDGEPYRENKALAQCYRRADTCEELTKFFYLLLEKSAKSYWLSSCILSYSYIGKRKKYVRKLVTAMPLPGETLNELKALILKRYRGRTVEFNTKVDPDIIIGGGILEIGYWRIDASIAGQLKRVKKQFIEKNRRIV